MTPRQIRFELRLHKTELQMHLTSSAPSSVAIPYVLPSPTTALVLASSPSLGTLRGMGPLTSS